jgi:anaerobic magnesium-protoporphyrin IX monomethyl ester cyclase
VDEALVRKFKAAGCWMIGFGFESGDQGMLDRMGKGATVEQAREAVRLCRKHGIEATGHFVLGYPGETEATQAKTLALARELDLDFAQFYCAVPFPGSPLYDRALANNWIKKKDWRLFEQNVSVLGVNGFKPEDVERWRRRAYMGFYASPRRAVKILRRVRSAGDVAGIARGLRDFLGWI